MKTYRFNEIINKHGQYIAYFSSQPGNTDLERCLNFLGNSKKEEITDPDGNKLYVVLEKDCFQVFNEIGEKVGAMDGLSGIKSLDDVSDYLSDLGYL
jgi:hypothetical protein